MKRLKKILISLMPIILLVLIISNSSVLGFAEFESGDFTIGEGKSGVVGNTLNNTWAIIKLILQIATVAAVIFAGVRYMFASVNSKADIKKVNLYYW